MQSQTPYELRVNRGYHLIRGLSKAANVRPETIRKYERGELRREDENVMAAFERIAKALGITWQAYAVAVRARVEARINGKAK